jgi:hypothetical protein
MGVGGCGFSYSRRTHNETPGLTFDLQTFDGSLNLEPGTWNLRTCEQNLELRTCELVNAFLTFDFRPSTFNHYTNCLPPAALRVF